MSAPLVFIDTETDGVHPGRRVWEVWSVTPSVTIPPWRSDDLSRTCGVEPPSDDERHTALGDARWALRWYDAMTGGAS